MSSALPATSCHLTYPLSSTIDTVSSWSLEATVSVEESTDCTYFCVVGWGPGGYSGIQQIDNQRKVAIFSMWNEGTNSVELVKAGPGAVVTTFGGEGTGLKCMKDFDWHKNNPVTFQITGQKEGEYWMCSCHYTYKDETFFMATYKRKGARPLKSTGFYSFVEDWDRQCDSIGHYIQRSAHFFDQKAEGDGSDINICSARFSKVEDGCDKFAADKAYGSCQSSRFYLSTGGCYNKHVANGTVLKN